MQFELSFEEFSQAIANELKREIEDLTENPPEAMFVVNNPETDANIRMHLIHCMKVVHDYYTIPSYGQYFDYNGASSL